MAEVEAAKKLRSTAKGKFTRAANNLGQAIDTEAPTKTIESRYDELKAAWNETQSKHDDFVKLLPGEELDEGWIEELRGIPCKNRPVDFRWKIDFFHFLCRSTTL